MSNDLIPVEPEASGLSVVRVTQAVKVFLMMVDGKSQAEACKAVGITPRAFQRWMRRPEFAQLIRKVSQDAITSMMTQAVAALPEAIAYQVKVAQGLEGNARDSTRALTVLLRIADRAGLLDSMRPPAPLAPAPPPEPPYVKFDDGEEEMEAQLAPGPVAFRPTFEGPTQVIIRPRVEKVLEAESDFGEPEAKEES